MPFTYTGSLADCAIEQEKLDGSESEEPDNEATTRKSLEEKNEAIDDVMYRKSKKVRIMLIAPPVNSLTSVSNLLLEILYRRLL